MTALKRRNTFIPILILLAVFIVWRMNVFYSTQSVDIHPSNYNISSDYMPVLNDTFTDERGAHHTIRIINQSFLHSLRRNYYGDSLPSKLNVIWKCNLGTGKTVVKDSVRTWSGAGWTGQPLMVEEDGAKYIIQGAYDHHLRKIEAATGRVIWKYLFDDVIKGTGTIWINTKAKTLQDRVIILQGSRLGAPFKSPLITSFRAVSYFTGRELWRLNSRMTDCYSRDVDGSAIVIRDTGYIGLENGIFTIFDPDPQKAENRQGIFQPKIYRDSDTLFKRSDLITHGKNLVTEASSAYINDRIYLSSGSGRVYGYNLTAQKFDWEFNTGSDLDGSTVISNDGSILFTIEKQYIKGNGGVAKIDPTKSELDALLWYLPTENKRFGEWEGGIIGSISINESTKMDNERSLGACIAIDGYLYVFDLNETERNKKVTVFDGIRTAPTPHVLFKYQMGPSISTPIFVRNRILAAGYNGIFLFEFDMNYKFNLIAHMTPPCEATPFANNGRVYIASRDGNLYCLSSVPNKPTNKKKQ